MGSITTALAEAAPSATIAAYSSFSTWSWRLASTVSWRSAPAWPGSTTDWVPCIGCPFTSRVPATTSGAAGQLILVVLLDAVLALPGGVHEPQQLVGQGRVGRPAGIRVDAVGLRDQVELDQLVGAVGGHARPDRGALVRREGRAQHDVGGAAGELLAQARGVGVVQAEDGRQRVGFVRDLHGRELVGVGHQLVAIGRPREEHLARAVVDGPPLDGDGLGGLGLLGGQVDELGRPHDGPVGLAHHEGPGADDEHQQQDDEAEPAVGAPQHRAISDRARGAAAPAPRSTRPFAWACWSTFCSDPKVKIWLCCVLSSRSRPAPSAMRRSVS